MSLSRQIREAARAAGADDAWYTQAEPYILELRTSQNVAKTGIPGGVAYLVLPLGPSEYSVDTVYRQSVTPTLGGLVTEEQDILWWEISISGTFGLAPKPGFDSTLPSPRAVLSGPGWVRRMVREYFDRYAALKADQETARETQLIWHDTRADDHWVVVPETLGVHRTPSTRVMHPWSIKLKGVERASRAQLPASETSAVLRAFRSAAESLDSVRRGAAMITAAIQEGSAALGELRFYVAQIDATLDQVTQVALAANDLVDGVTDTLSVGRVFVSSATTALQAALDLMENTAEIPAEVRRNYKLAGDGLDLIASQPVAFGRPFAAEATRRFNEELGAAALSQEDLDARQARTLPQSLQAMSDSSGTRQQDALLVASGAAGQTRTLRRYVGSRPYTVRRGDTLQSIAAKLIGDAAAWVDIAQLNNLQAPYITPYGGPRTVAVGEQLAVPQETQAPEVLGVVGAGEAQPDPLFRDFAWVPTDVSTPGRLNVDFAIDRRTLRDFMTVEGLDNLAQALQLRVATERETLSNAPGYGLQRSIGAKSSPGFVPLFRLGLSATLGADSRVGSVREIAVTLNNDHVVAEAAVNVVVVDSSIVLTVVAE